MIVVCGSSGMPAIFIDYLMCNSIFTSHIQAANQIGEQLKNLEGMESEAIRFSSRTTMYYSKETPY